MLSQRDYSCVQALWIEPRSTVENMQKVIEPMEENWDNEVEWIMFWGRLGRTREFVPWARHSFIEGLWKNHLGFILEWRGVFLFTCFLWELQKFVQFPVRVRVTIISSLQCGDTKVCIYAKQLMENAENFSFAYARLLASTEAEESKGFSEYVKKGEREQSVVQNTDHKLVLHLWK